MEALAYRRLGRHGLDTYLAHHGRGPSPHLDAVCGQIGAHTALLYWHTSMDAALADARATGRPILSLRLLGRLDEELSCANSRFFRKLLYPEPRINRALRERFVLHWQSVRPVPRVTIDFGGGRQITRTVTGNSVHVVLDPRGAPADALPGLFAPDVFLALLDTARAIALADPRQRAELHRRALATPPGPAAAGRGTPPPELAPRRAVAASAIAPTKHMVEMPVLRALLPDDTRANHALHARIRASFAAGQTWPTVDAMVARIYSDLFLMPPDDPTLGLDIPDPVA